MTVTEYINLNLPKTVKLQTDDADTLIGLPYKYTVPCPDEMFLEMYYWDTYFTNLGLIETGNTELAKNNINNMIYLVEKYGFMPNGNRTYYLTRSQPPFLFMAVSDIYAETGDKEWLGKAYDAIKKEYSFWTEHRSTPDGLNFYGNEELCDPDRIDKLYKYFCSRTKHEYENCDFKEKLKYAHCMMTFMESGWDCTSRFGDNGRYYEPVCLNSLLWGLESTMSRFIEILCWGEEKLWEKRAMQRKEKMEILLSDKELGLMLDRNFSNNTLSKVVSAASLYPLFVGMKSDADNEAEALRMLMTEHGVSATADCDGVNHYQWDYPNIWAPLQYISYKAFINGGRADIAEEIKNKYLHLVEKCFDKTGKLWEKYNGITGEVANEDYNAPAMLGWTAGVYMYFKRK